MMLALAALDLLLLIVILFVLLRRYGQTSEHADADPRVAALAAELPTQFARLETRLATLDEHLRSSVTQIRADTSAEAQAGREAAERSAAALRTEVLGNVNALGETLRSGLDSFRKDNTGASETLRQVVDAQLAGLTQRFMGFATDMAREHAENRETLHARLTDLGNQYAAHQERLRGSVEERLEKLNQANAAKLEEMRQTVDEKLHATLQTRLTESFGQVTDQLTKVHAGLGEMTKLSAGVDDLSRIFTNVKSRGGFAEVQLGMLLQQMLAPSQFQQNVRVKPNTQEVVEYAVKFPTPQGETLLPIDAKFPREAWERLETAYETGSAAEIASAGKAFESAIRIEGKRICDKYIAPPATTSFAIMFLPTEGLYAEVMRRDGLQSDLQQNCRVTIAGPSTLSAILNSFQMGFHMLQMQEKGDEVWKVLAAARTQFGKFEDLMGKMSKDVEKVQNTLGEVATRTRVINRTLKDVSLEPNGNALSRGAALSGMLPLLAAEEDE
ncbi:MAG TPA: DNA recombination protein RmuC [Acidobacteriaceae bacterium]|nr:DNA recombination protein RmuC [Acidobacteriaceae bacterium]